MSQILNAADALLQYIKAKFGYSGSTLKTYHDTEIIIIPFRRSRTVDRVTSMLSAEIGVNWTVTKVPTQYAYLLIITPI